MKNTRLATWDMSTLMSKMMKLVNVMRKRKIDIAFLQQTKGRRTKPKQL